jgi:hypothetical protein
VAGVQLQEADNCTCGASWIDVLLKEAQRFKRMCIHRAMPTLQTRSRTRLFAYLMTVDIALRCTEESMSHKSGRNKKLCADLDEMGKEIVDNMYGSYMPARMVLRCVITFIDAGRISLCQGPRNTKSCTQNLQNYPYRYVVH